MNGDLGTRVVRGAAWMIAGQWSVRLIGLVSTAILARLLTPADFGLVAMAMIVVGLVDVLFDFGAYSAVIRRADTTDDHLNTAWTMGILQGCAAAIVLLAISPLAARYFEEPRVESVMWVIALAAALRGLENIGLVKYKKSLEFNRIFAFDLTKRIVMFAVTLVLALTFRSYWALAWAQVAGAMFGVGLSYLFHPYRPRISLGEWRELWSVSKWIMLSQVGDYFARVADRIILGRRADATTLGHYTVAFDIAQLPADGLITPMRSVLLPAFALVRDDPVRLERAYGRAVAGLALVGMPAYVGIACVAPTLVPVVLGTQWLPAVVLIQIISLQMVSWSVTCAGSILVINLGRQAQFALWTWISLGMFLMLALVVFPAAGAVGFALIRLGQSALGIVYHFGFLFTQKLVRWRTVADAVWRPIVGSTLMAGLLFALSDGVFGHGVGGLIGQILLGSVTYAATVIGLWFVSGRADGTEAAVFARIRVLIS